MIQARKSMLAVACAAAVAGTAAPAFAAEASGTLVDAIRNGDLKFQFRYRYEDVNQDNALDTAEASTLKSRLTFTTQAWQGWQAQVEVDDVSPIGDDDYNSTNNNETGYSVVADPEGTEINQAWIAYSGLCDSTLKFGRQRVLLDNERFVGGVGWRQNEQTYDALTLKTSALAKTQLQYSYLHNVNRVSGPDEGSQPANYHGDSHAFNGKADLGRFGGLTGFAYLLDFDNALALSSSTYGVHWTGAHEFANKSKANWIASYAYQTEYADNPNDFSADYYLLEAGYAMSSFGVKAGYEVLSGDTEPNQAFQTPLATLHAFQGWADKFLTTPRGGVEDLYLGATANFGALALQLVWHDFQAEAFNQDYGSEWNASAAYKFGGKKNYEALLKFADYQADDFATDTTKLWLQFSAAF